MKKILAGHKMAGYLFLMFLVVSGCASTKDTTGDAAPRMTAEQLRGMLNDPEVLVIDVRAPSVYLLSGTRIPGAVRENPYSPESWIDRYDPGKTLVLYCT
jgi:hypothetical protein